ncbi:MAG: YHS domain-containing protein [Candidatus Brocadia sp.]|nr:YHS domain-containing protein [Candidatus Brocadia sp.]
MSEEYKGKIYYFCSEQCKKTFKKGPASHIPTESSQGFEVPIFGVPICYDIELIDQVLRR